MSTTRSVKDTLTEAGQEILKDVACDVVFSAMTDAEQAEAGEPVVEFPDAGEPTLEAMADYAARKVAARFGSIALASAQWTQWAKTLYTKGIQKGDTNRNKIIDNGEKIVLPEWTGSRAFVYYARFCLAPPK